MKNNSDTLFKDIQIVSVGFKDKGIHKKIKPTLLLAPNPCKEFLQIQTSNYNPQKITAHIYIQIGTELISLRLFSGVNTIDMDDLIQGIYFISIFENGRMILTKNFNRM